VLQAESSLKLSCAVVAVCTRGAAVRAVLC